MAASELKALTFIHLPFVDESYAPGNMIPRSSFDEYVSLANASVTHNPEDEGATPLLDADEVIAEMIKYGSLSDDPSAPVHPDHIPVDPNRPTIALLIEQAKQTMADLTEKGQEVPAELQKLAELDHQHVTSGDNGNGGDKHVG